MYAGSLLRWLHAEYLLPRHKRYAGRRGEKDRRIHVRANRDQVKKNPLIRRKHRAKTVRCFPLLSAFGSRFGSETFLRLLRAREVKLTAVTF